MAKENKGVVEYIKESVVQAIEGTGDVVTTFIDVLGNVVQQTIKTTGATGTRLIRLLSEAILIAIQGVVEMGGNLGQAAKGMVIGVFRMASVE